MHVQTCLLHGEGEVRAHHRQVPECPSQAAIRLGVVDCGAVGGDLALGVNHSGHCLARRHTCTLEDVFSEPLLGHVEPIGGTLDVDAEEESEHDHVFDGELSSETIDDIVRKMDPQQCPTLSSETIGELPMLKVQPSPFIEKPGYKSPTLSYT